MRILVFIFAILQLFALIQQDAMAAAAGGMPRAVWEDNDRNHRRSPPQVKNQLKVPRVQAGVSNTQLPEDAQRQRAAKARNAIAASAPVAPMPALEEGGWRLKIMPAAITNTDNVLLGDIAVPLGNMDENLWFDLQSRELWPAPPDEGKPLQINKSRLSQAIRQALGQEYAARCILPSSLSIQRGGVVFQEDDLRKYVVNSLAPQLAAMPGEAELTDFRLPEYIFLAHDQQQVQLEPGKIAPGRIPLKFAVKEADGSVLRRVAGTTTLTLWVTAPSAARPLNKGEILSPDAITFMRVNASQMKDMPWDGHGGPWQIIRSIGKGEPILQSDLVSKMVVRRGNILTLRYKRGNLSMTIQAEALADGQPGETIPVRNLQTKKQVYATVKDGSTVEIN